MNYFEGKEERAIKADNHTEEMWKKHTDEIYDCVAKTKRYSNNISTMPRTAKKQQIVLTDEDSVSAVFNHQKGRVCVLNFASYKNPGGMFLKGSKAQEECLCHESFLYNVLNEFIDGYYSPHLKTLNKALYTNEALYSPGVKFIRNKKECLADVLTCAAPNYKAAYKYQNVSREQNSKVLKDRTKFVLDIASNEGIDTLILGAWGCGVFGQEPSEVAECFLEELKNHQDIENIVFAVIDKNSENYKAFENCIKGYI